MAGIAVCRAIKKVLQLTPQIKWVNDIYINEKKVCGILTQGAFSLEDNTSEYIILGIGINIYEPQEGFPSEINEISTSLATTKQGGLRNTLIAEILNELYNLYLEFNIPNIVEEYKSLNFVIGKEVSIITANSTTTAKVLDIDSNCALVVECNTGETKTLNSGEISIRPTT